MTHTPSHTHLSAIVPAIDHPCINALRNGLSSKKIDIPVQLIKDGAEIYAATVFMSGHSHALYQAALFCVLDDLAACNASVEWDHVIFHSATTLHKKTDITALSGDSIADFIRTYRGMPLQAAMNDVIAKLPSRTDGTITPAHVDRHLLRLCGAIIAQTVEVVPTPAYTPTRKPGVFRRLFPRR